MVSSRNTFLMLCILNGATQKLPVVPLRLCYAGQPSKPQNVKILAGTTTLKVTWDKSATDTASAYNVKIYADAGATTFTLPAVGSWDNLPWDNPNGAVTVGTLVYNSETSPHYTFTTPTLTPVALLGGWICPGMCVPHSYCSHPIGGSVLSTVMMGITAAALCHVQPPVARLLPC